MGQWVPGMLGAMGDGLWRAAAVRQGLQRMARGSEVVQMAHGIEGRQESLRRSH